MTDFKKLAAGLEAAIGPKAKTQGPTCWLDTGFAPLNHAISGSYDGGFPGARIVEIFGPESSGKTWLATNAMIAAQKMGGYAAFADHERSFKTDVAVALGLDEDRFWPLTPESYESSMVTFVKGTTSLRANGLPMSAPICWVFDSLPSMVPQQKLQKDATELNMNDTTALARLTSQTFPAMAQIAEKNNVLVIVLNQIRLKPGVVYGDPTTTPGGEAPRYYASVRIQLGAKRIVKEENGERVMLGQEVTARCIKNKVSRPFVAAKWRFIFGEDGVGRFDVPGSLVDFAVAQKVLTQTGTRIEWEGKTYFKSVLAEKIEKEGLTKVLMDKIKAAGVKPELAVEPAPAEVGAAVVGEAA